MGLRPVMGDVALPLTARGAGTYTSGTVGPSGAAGDVVLLVHATAVSGTPTLDVSLEESSDGTTWTAITGSAITQLTAAGNRTATATVSKAFVRMTSTVGGTTPSVTFKATLLIW